MESRIKNQAQHCAKFAYDEVAKAKEQLKDKAKEFKSHVKDVPIMIRTNGLAAAYAFVYSKAKDKADYNLIQDISQRWLESKGVLKPQSVPEFYKSLTELERESYRRAIRELLVLFTWLKRFADGMIEN